MIITKNQFGLLLVIALFLLTRCQSFGQTASQNTHPDTSQKISLAEFNARVDSAIVLLQTKKLVDIKDAEHINIMMCLNTIFMRLTKERGPQIRNGPDGHLKMYETKRRFTGGRYDELEIVAEKSEYSKRIIDVYPQWVPDRGMGFLFPKLQIEFYGTPHLYSYFDVRE